MAKKDENGITRRDLIGLGGAAAGAALVGGVALPSLPAEAQAAPLPQVPRRVLGKTGKSVPILLMGGSMGFDTKFDPRLAEAVRFGVNYVDAADCYAGGKSETGLAAYLARAKNRDRIWITSKSDDHDPKGFEKTVFQSLDRIGTDYIDMYYLHDLTKADVLNADLAVTVARLKKAGKFRHFGFSCHAGNVAELLHKAAQTPWVESVMFRYNFRSYGDKELNGAIDAAHKAGVGLIAMKTQGSEAGFRTPGGSSSRPGSGTSTRRSSRRSGPTSGSRRPSRTWTPSRSSARTSRPLSTEPRSPPPRRRRWTATRRRPARTPATAATSSATPRSRRT
jgi:uncharacterized protein